MLGIIFGILAAFSPMDLFDLEFFSDPQLSPDSSKVLFVKQSAHVETDSREANIWMIGTDGSNLHQVTTNGTNNFSPRFSPKGDRFAFLSAVDGQAQIFLWDQGDLVQLTELATPPGSISWSPDGSMLAFTSLIPTKQAPIGDFPEPPEGSEWATCPRVIEDEPYLADGAGFIEPGYSHLFLLPIDGGAPRQISFRPQHHGAVSWLLHPAPAWTPDGKRLISMVMSSAQDTRDSSLWSFSVEDGSSKRLTPEGFSASAPSISPDGEWIAFIGCDIEYTNYSVRKLYVMDQEGERVRCLTPDLDRSVYQPQWTGDSQSICFFYDDRGSTKLGCCSLDGTFRCLATHLGGNGLAYGGPFGGAGFSLGHDGTYVFNATRSDLPCSLKVGHLNHEAAVTLLDSRPKTPLNRVEEFYFQSPLDGALLHGWILKPPQFSASKKWPLILHVHGGPSLNFGDRFDIEHQLWSSAGYIVAYINYRGSSSYGETFARLIDKSFPLGIEEDLDGAVDVLLERDYLDPDQLFITGPSAGGCLTCWMVGHSNRFRAAASSYPVVNWYSKVLTSDIGRSTIRNWFHGTPWDNPEHFLERSPISYVGNVSTPTMLLCGEDDHRTPMSEATQFYQALKFRDVDAALVRFPDEPHGVRTRPSHQLAKALYIQGWFDRYRCDSERAR